MYWLHFTGPSLGSGTYFSSDPHRSLDFAHSATPNVYILIVVKVLVGDFCLGHPGLLRPPLKAPHGQVIDKRASELLRLRHPPGARRPSRRQMRRQQSAAAATRAWRGTSCDSTPLLTTLQTRRRSSSSRTVRRCPSSSYDSQPGRLIELSSFSILYLWLCSFHAAFYCFLVSYKLFSKSLTFTLVSFAFFFASISLLEMETGRIFSTRPSPWVH